MSIEYGERVRRMLEAVGHRVVSLQRIAFGPLRLGDLAPGASRRLSAAEVERLRKATEGSRQAPPRISPR